MKIGASKTADGMYFSESYGRLTSRQLRAYRKWDITPAEHDMLVDYVGSNGERIADYLNDNEGFFL